MNPFVAGLDLGQMADYSCLVIIEKAPPLERPEFHVVHLERFRLGTPYPAIVREVSGLLRQPPLLPTTPLVIDATGCGLPVYQIFKERLPSALAVTITGGHQESGAGGNWHVPKVQLISGLQAMLQTGRLRFAEALPLVDVLVKELLNYRVQITDAGNETFAPWRTSDHDDCVLALALALWKAQRGVGFAPYAESTPARDRYPLQSGDDPHTHHLLGSVTIKGPSNPAFDWMEYRSDRAGDNHE